MDPHALIEALWIDYASITPDARRIHALLEARGEKIVNDHIALRTFDLPDVHLSRIAAPFESRGWRRTGEYVFDAKKLDAISLSHDDASLPRVFISQLRTAELGERARGQVEALVAAAPQRSDTALLLDRPTWPAVGHDVYLELLELSEYAAWLAAFGLRANHFTVSVNALRSFPSLRALDDFLIASGFELNGGDQPIQGGVEVLLEQSSTVAAPIEWTFGDRDKHIIRGCYYEFARRYTDPQTGALFDRFIARSADKIFESTDARLRGL